MNIGKKAIYIYGTGYDPERTDFSWKRPLLTVNVVETGANGDLVPEF